MRLFKIIFTLICCASLSKGVGQTLEHTYSNSWYQEHLYADLSSQADKFVVISDTGRKARVYNLDHSIYTTFNLPKPVLSGYDRVDATLYSVSDNLINSDSELEFIYTVYYVNSQSLDYKAFVRIYNESGSLLFEKQDAYIGDRNNSIGTGIIKASNGYKLILFHAANGSAVGTIYTYGLEGSLPTSTLKQAEKSNARLDHPEPNPSSETAKISFELPQGEDTGEIFVYNTQGILMKKYLVDNTYGDLLLNNQDLPAGTYYYNLMAGNKYTETKKMVVIK